MPAHGRKFERVFKKGLQFLKHPTRREKSASSGPRMQIDDFFQLGEFQDEAERARLQDEINGRMREEREWVKLHGDESAIREFPLIAGEGGFRDEAVGVLEIEIEIGDCEEDGEGGHVVELREIDSLDRYHIMVEPVDMV